LKRPAAARPQVTAGLKCPPEIDPTAYAIASTAVPMANATVINPADGTENNAAPHTEVTSINVPINSAINLRVIVPASSKRSARHVAKGSDDSIRESVGQPSALSGARRTSASDCRTIAIL